jgi:hypothetical protein
MRGAFLPTVAVLGLVVLPHLKADPSSIFGKQRTRRQSMSTSNRRGRCCSIMARRPNVWAIRVVSAISAVSPLFPPRADIVGYIGHVAKVPLPEVTRFIRLRRRRLREKGAGGFNLTPV